jgi:methanogenic corrinoid protein MtbC1
VLRAWEARYGLLRPERTEGGLRLFTPEDERRVRLMRRNIAAGLSAAEAARLATQGEGADPERSARFAQNGSTTHERSARFAQNGSTTHERSPTFAQIETALAQGVDALDEPMAQAALDQLFRAFALPFALAEVILPFLRRLGERWAAAQASVAHEHFASNVIGGRLRALTPGWGSGVGPRAVLACPPGERHDLGLLCFGLALREHGWRIAYLGAETPLREIADTLDGLVPSMVVLSAVDQQRFLDASEGIAALAWRVRVGVGGAGASPALAQATGAELLGGDAIGEAAALAT